MKIFRFTKSLYFYLFLLLGSLLLAIYSKCLEALYAYQGFKNLEFSSIDLLFYLPSFLLVLWVFPKKLKRPSDNFLYIYILLIIFPCILFASASHLLELQDKILLFAIQSLPVVLVKISQRYRLRIPSVKIGNISYAMSVVVILLIIGLSIGLMKTGGDGSFTYDDVYVRRLSGREIFPSRSFEAYAISLAVNGAAPCLAFLGALRKKIFYVLAAFAGPLIGFYILGVKSAFFLVCISAFLGLIFKSKKFIYASTISLTCLVLISVFSIYEISTTSNVLVTDLFIRRSLVHPVIAQAFYYDLLKNLGPLVFSQGVNTDGYLSVTYLIGDQYMNNPLDNANTNSFLFHLAQQGVPGYIFNVGFILGIFMLMDNYFLNGASAMPHLVCIIYSYFLTEQSFLTSLFSSGVFMLILMVVFFSPNKNTCGTFNKDAY
jgi:hypothetical protein